MQQHASVLARRIFRTPAAAEYLALKESTLEKLRLTGGGPVFVRLGPRAVGYDLRDLDAWIEDQKRASTSDAGLPRARPARRA